MNDLQMFGLNVEPKEFWDVIFFSVVRMQIERDAYGTDEERRKWLERRITLSEAILQRISFEGNAVIESVEQKGGTNNVMIGDIMVLDRDLIEILKYAVQGIRVEKAISENLTDEHGERLEALAEKARKAAERLETEF